MRRARSPVALLERLGENGWTGGQYSLVRIALGSWLALRFLLLIAWGPELWSAQGAIRSAAQSPHALVFPNLLAAFDSPEAVRGLLAASTLFAVAFAAGYGDRVAAIALWYSLACLHGRNPLAGSDALPFVGWILLLHALLPHAPYGSLAALRRDDPGASWRFPAALHGALWLVLGCAFAYAGVTKLLSPSWLDGSALGRLLADPVLGGALPGRLLLALPDPLLRAASFAVLAFELAFLPLALWRRARPYAWSALGALQLGLLVFTALGDLALGLLLVQLVAFDPRWLPVSRQRAGIVFYDGSCGLCHGVVRLVLAEDHGGRFRFAPLGGEAFGALVPAGTRGALPDSVVVHSPGGELLVRTRAVAYLLRELGGIWTLLGRALEALPRRPLDRAYDEVARLRLRWFRRPRVSCPAGTPALRARFYA
jgi:predicted DCC family thiol-disulfide oxidoreductase YuxK